MVKSKLDESIFYKENKNMEEVDIGKETSIYEVPFENYIINIAIGNTQYHNDSEIIYFPIYYYKEDDENNLVKIGIYETNDKLINLYDDDGDLDLEKMNNPLFFNFFTKEWLSKHKQEEHEEEEDIIIKIPEQTKKQSKDEKKVYEKIISQPWITTFLKNNNISELDNEGGGDCLFAVIRDAYKTQGKSISVEELRKKLSDEASMDIFQNFKSQYEMYDDAVKELSNEMKSLNKKNEELRRSVKSKSRNEQLELLSQSQEIKTKYDSLKDQKEVSQELGNEFYYMEKIDSLEKFKNYLTTSNYWADSWAINVLEYLLKIKIILFSEESFENNDMSNVILCGEGPYKSYKPNFYIMASYTGDHYKLITYYDKGLLSFKEIPYDVKMLIINKCMETLAGPYYSISEFRKLQEELGIEINNNEPETINDEYKKPIFQYYSHSTDKKFPGKATGEYISEEDALKFTQLSKIKNWRQKLDNSWAQAFTLDGHKWQSVEHYYNAVKFKNSHPDFYLKFTLDKGSEFNTDIQKAKAAGSKEGKLNGKLIRPKNIKIDSDFYENNNNKKQLRNALEAKFTQNKDLKNVLLETKNADLLIFKRTHKPKLAKELIELRDSLINM